MSELSPEVQATVEAYQRLGSHRKVAAELGCAQSTVWERLKKASRQGVAPGHFEYGTATGYLMGKVTVQRRGDGTVERTWERQHPEAWGRTKRREIHCGHRHHRDEKEYNGVTVVQHPTLAARDAYAARGGWIADRAAWAITYHKRFGGVGRVAITPEMLAA